MTSGEPYRRLSRSASTPGPASNTEDALMAVRAKVLCENAVYGTLGAVAEHGWSVWLETPSGAFLFDTGQGQSILNNARVFGLPLEEARAILISHHHIDHKGGLLETVH